MEATCRLRTRAKRDGNRAGGRGQDLGLGTASGQRTSRAGAAVHHGSPGSSDPGATNDVRVALEHCLAGNALERLARQLTLNRHPGRGTHNRSICRAPASSSVDHHRAQSRRSVRPCSGTPVALRHDRWPRLSREIRRSGCQPHRPVSACGTHRTGSYGGYAAVTSSSACLGALGR